VIDVKRNGKFRPFEAMVCAKNMVDIGLVGLISHVLLALKKIVFVKDVEKN